MGTSQIQLGSAGPAFWGWGGFIRNRLSFLYIIIIFIHQINDRHKYKKCNKKSKVNKENNHAVEGQAHKVTRALRTRESKPTTPYITLQ